MEVKIMSQAGPEKRTIKATCEQRLLQSTAQAPGFYGGKIPSKHRVGRGPWSSHAGNSIPSLHRGTHKTVQMYAEGWIQGAEIQATQKRGSGGSSWRPFFFFFSRKQGFQLVISLCNPIHIIRFWV